MKRYRLFFGAPKIWYIASLQVAQIQRRQHSLQRLRKDEIFEWRRRVQSSPAASLRVEMRKAGVKLKLPGRSEVCIRDAQSVRTGTKHLCGI